MMKLNRQRIVSSTFGIHDCLSPIKIHQERRRKDFQCLRHDDSRSFVRCATKNSFTGSKVIRNYHSSSLSSTSAVNDIKTAASNYLNSIRLKAATILAESLPPARREHLLKSLNAVDEKYAVENTSKSIGEAVALALEKETKRVDEQWEQKIKEVEQKTEQAVMDRFISEMKIELGETESNREDHHPLLGAPVIDLGYKTVYTTSVKNLRSIPVWERQRAYRHERAEKMAKEKIKRKDAGLPGIIALHEAPNGQLSILDGQHRVGMMIILQEKNLSKSETGIDLDNILVEVFSEKNIGESLNEAATGTSSSSTFAKNLFTEINKAEPIKLVDMPGIANSSERKIINDAASLIEDSFREMFKPSQRCRAPHINVDNLRDALFTSDVLNRHSIRSEEELVNWILKQNKDLGEKYKNYSDKNNSKQRGKGFSKTVLEKAIKFDFYLGLESTWLYK